MAHPDDPDPGYVIIKLAGGGELWVSADWEGCHVFISERPRGI